MKDATGYEFVDVGGVIRSTTRLGDLILTHSSLILSDYSDSRSLHIVARSFIVFDHLSSFGKEK